jgi:predicted Zn-ribbon and HTH transcriptional regulator
MERFFQDQESIKQLQKRNTELHAAIYKFVNKESKSKEIIQHLVANAEWVAREGKKLSKQFGTKQKAGRR